MGGAPEYGEGVLVLWGVMVFFLALFSLMVNTHHVVV